MGWGTDVGIPRWYDLAVDARHQARRRCPSTAPAAGEDIETWISLWSDVQTLAGQIGVDPPTAYFVFQTVIGALPISRDRLNTYLIKAAREAKLGTTWHSPDEAYEDRVARLGIACSHETAVADRLHSRVRRLQPSETALNLSLKLLQLTLPGVPDVYQGSEMSSYSLVDPDNRRPVDFGPPVTTRWTGWTRARGGTDSTTTSYGSRLVPCGCAVRPDAFGPESSYRPVDIASPHAIGFERGAGATLATRWPQGLAESGWQDAEIELPRGSWTDALPAMLNTRARLHCQPCSPNYRSPAEEGALMKFEVWAPHAQDFVPARSARTGSTSSPRTTATGASTSTCHRGPCTRTFSTVGEARSDPRALRLPEGPEGPAPPSTSTRSSGPMRCGAGSRCLGQWSTRCTSGRSPPRAPWMLR